MAIGVASVGFSDAKLGISLTRALTIVAAIEPRIGAVEWGQGTVLDVAAKDLGSAPAEGARYLDLAPASAKVKSYDAWAKSFKTWLGQSQSLDLLKSRSSGLVSAPGESERDFRVRLQTAAREQRDQAVEKLRQKYASKLAALDDRIRRAEQAVERESSQATQQKLQTAVSMGATVLGALFGRKKLSASTLGKATTTARGMGRTMKESEDIGRAQESLEAARAQKADLEAQVQADVDALGGTMDPATEVLDAVTLKPKRTDLSVQVVGLAWAPEWVDTQGQRTPAYR
jgi:Sec-independent protein translocase protein TatA